MSNEIMR